ncbi:ATP-binding protein [Candidatus Tokpelaia sp.]|uniref:ATP-binding protein n=1 Tax=Candidatus Tokpelaia sp. TaxID=2233777 RepID=UPI00123A3076|nr:ATP-binding protein [Candidatus Tokpelaia sp.]KAA6404705.1 hybrid sensor histidine kinase/response regulator [Candidatus Tokpelaia sp.]
MPLALRERETVLAENQPDTIGQAKNIWAVVLRCFYIALIGAAFIGIVLVFQYQPAEKAILSLISLYAAVGIFFLLCAAFGLCRFGLKEADSNAAADVLDNLAAAIALTDKKGRFVYGNKAYRQLAGAAPVAPEILLARDNQAAEAAGRLSEAAEKGRFLQEIVRHRYFLPVMEGKAIKPPVIPAEAVIPPGLSTGEAAGDKRNHDWRIDVRPFFSGGYALAIWTITVIEARESPPDFIHHLQAAVGHFDNAPAGFLSWDTAGRLVFFNAALARLVQFDFSQPAEVLSLENIFGRENGQRISVWEQDLRRRAAVQQGNKEKAGDYPDITAALPLYVADAGGEQKILYLYMDSKQAEGAVSHALLLPENVGRLVAGAPPDTGDNAVADKPAAEQEQAQQFDINDYFYRSPIALAVIKRGLQYMQVNARFNAMFALVDNSDTAAFPPETGQNRAKREIIRFFAAIAEPERERVMQAVNVAFTTGAGPAAPLDVVLPGEETRYIRLYITPVRADSRGHEAVIVSVVEITRQRALEQQMEHSQKMQAVGQLAGGIAHDFNNVLTAIIMSCDLLLGSHRSSDPSHPDIINIKNNAGRAASLVRQLLAFSRRQTLRPEILDLTDMLADLRLLVVRLAGDSVRLKIEHGQSLWAVKADQAELERVIMNLVANARDAMPQGGDLIIRTDNISRAESRNLPYQAFEPGDYVLIEVADSGGGIAPEIMEKIFDPFFTTKEVGKGTGLGLSMVYGIVSQTGGYIYCRSAVGEGTVFSIYLPRYIARQNMMPDSVFAAASGAAGSPLPGQTAAGGQYGLLTQSGIKLPKAEKAIDLSGSANVLLVEDEDAVRMGGVKALQSRGYTVFEAASGVEALRIIKERQGAIDIVVSDVVMPEMDGPTLLKELQQFYPNIKFIFVSGYAQEAFAKNLPENADFAFLAKPFSLKQLAGTVKTMLEENGAQAGL